MAGTWERLKARGAALFAWCARHKVASVIIALAAAGLFYSNVVAPDSLATKGASAAQGAEESDLLTASAQAFLEEYGCFSYLDALDTGEMGKYAHKDLCRAVGEERVAAYAPPGEAPDAQTAQDRMRAQGLVRTCDLEAMSMLSQDGSTYQIRAELSEYTFTSEGGLRKEHATYILEMRKNEAAGTGSPYQAVRIFRE